MKNVYKIVTILIILFAIAYTLIGCKYTSTTSLGRKPINASVLFANSNAPYLSEIQKALKDIQKENNDKIKFTFYDAKYNQASQESTINNLLQDGNVDILFVNLVNKGEDSVRKLIDKAKQRKIPIVLFNYVEPNTIDIVKSYEKAFAVATDENQAGILEGKLIVDAWNTDKSSIDRNGDGVLQYLMLQASSNNSVAVTRTRNAISAINNAGIKTEELALINTNFDRDLAKEAVKSLLLRYNDKIEAIIANNDAMAIGAIEALQTYGYNKGDKSKNISIVGIDGVSEAKDLVDKGLMLGTIVHDPRLIAEALYKIGMNLISNENPIEGINYEVDKTGIEVLIPYEEYKKLQP